ncbi:MAG: cysteine-rich protein, partial [Myxococcaceae bacterium]|nr:cysteine-rich protein [Myxococcaceae bacterium]
MNRNMLYRIRLRACALVALLTQASCQRPCAEQARCVPVAALSSASDAGALPAAQAVPAGPVAKRTDAAAGALPLCHDGADCNTRGSQAFDQQDYAQAQRYFERACELDHPAGCEALALSLNTGHRELVVRDERRAIAAMQKACELQNLEACGLLANLYRQGSAEPGAYARDPARAFKLWEQTCRSGAGASCASLADCYQEGVGTKRDPARARQYR